METRFWITRVLFSATAVFMGTACPGLNQANVDGTGESGDEGSTATTLPTTAGMTMTTADMTMTGGGSGDATSGDSDGGTTMSVSATDGTTTDNPTTDGETTVGEDTGPGSTTEPGESTSTGDPTTGGPCMPMGVGDYANCMDGANCNGGSAACIDLGEGDGVCTFQCSDVCDCPPAPDGATVACGDVAPEGMGNDCYLTCEAGEECPTDMECFGGMICAYSNPPYGYYEGCNDGTECPAGAFCGVSGGYSTCVDPDCNDPSDCPTPPPGGTATCENGFTGSPGSIECYLDCSGPLDCPEGWTCISNYVCMQEDP